MRLVTPEKVVEIAFTNGSTNELGYIKDSIINAAQLRWIKPALGNDLWDLLETESLTSYSAVNQLLIDKLEAPAAFFVKGELVPDMSINTTAAGLQVLTTEYSAPASDKQRGQIQDQSFLHADSLLKEVIRWLEKDENINNYPTYYTSKNVLNTTPIKGGIVL